MTRPVPVLLCFDVEPDEIEVGADATPWLGFERLLERVKPLRDDLAEATGRPVRFDWFLRMDPQIAEAYGTAGWVVDRFGADLARLRSEGDLIGLHPHALRPTATAGRWVADHGDPDWVDHCLEVSYETFETAFGEPCRAQRFGDRFMSARSLRRAGELGAHYDLTVEPGAGPAGSLHHGLTATGESPEMRHAPREPYRADPDDPMRAAEPPSAAAPSRGDDTGPWMIPLTSMDPDPMLPAWRRIARRVRHPAGPWHRPTTLTARWPAAPFWPMVERRLDEMSQPYLSFAIRSDAPLMPSLMRPIEEKLTALLTSPLAERLIFTTPDAIVGDDASVTA